MSDTRQQIGTAVGAIVGGTVGFFVAGPAGAAKGALRGGALGYSLTAPGPEEQSPTYSFGEEYNTASQTIPVPVVYGENKVAGNTIYKNVSGENDENMAIQVAVSEGPIEVIEDIKVNDVNIEDLHSNSGVAEDHLENENYSIRLGERDQDQTGIGEQNYPYTAYISALLSADDDLSGNVTITSIVKGRKVEVWDDEALEWVTEYSRNPAYCLLDFITNDRYGLGISKEDIDLDSFIEAGLHCDEEVDGEPRYQLDYVIDFKQSSLDHIQEILATFRGYLIYSAGEFRLKIDRPESSVQSFDMSNIVMDSFSYEKTSKKDRYNRVSVEYTDPDANWDKLVARVNLDRDITERGLNEETISLLGINRYSQASRQAQYFQKKSWYCTTFCQFRVGIDALHCEAGDVVKVSHDVPGWEEKKFRILSIQEEENDEMVLSCQEYQEAIYAEELDDFEYSLDTDLPNPYEKPPHVKNLSVSENGEIMEDGTWVNIIE
ncbi:MAG: phage tail protein, partial [bacterium]